MKLHHSTVIIVLQLSIFQTILGNHWSLQSISNYFGRNDKKRSPAVKKGEEKSALHQLTGSEGPLTLTRVVDHLNSLAPLHLKEPWDNVGLLVEPPTSRTIKTIFLTNDLTMPVLQEAINVSADMIISYHPPIFKGLKRVTCNSWKEKIIGLCVENSIAVYSPHTCWDVMSGGTADWLASAFHPAKIEPIITPRPPAPEDKNIRFLVEVHGARNLKSNAHMKTLLGSGSSKIISTNPKEKRFSLTITSQELPFMLNKISKTFSGSISQIKLADSIRDADLGVGRFVTLEKPTQIKDLIAKVKHHLNVSQLQLALSFDHSLDHYIKKIALVPGSGASVLLEACGDAELFLTGEMSHHELLDANHQNVTVILAHHSNTERGFLRVMAQKLRSTFSTWPGTSIVVSDSDKDPLFVI
ncbi:unnamed protein product [Bemisia tabaci]|uniref:NIF3-like protein 1 n=1 Tax=Bemisia tabaci TaxID=7038 RepID=A0A9P0F6A6_BEMTA|nr:unnamed protein product [Bemisia tabaci]